MNTPTKRWWKNIECIGDERDGKNWLTFDLKLRKTWISSSACCVVLRYVVVSESARISQSKHTIRAEHDKTDPPNHMSKICFVCFSMSGSVSPRHHRKPKWCATDTITNAVVTASISPHCRHRLCARIVQTNGIADMKWSFDRNRMQYLNENRVFALIRIIQSNGALYLCEIIRVDFVLVRARSFALSLCCNMIPTWIGHMFAFDIREQWTQSDRRYISMLAFASMCLWRCPCVRVRVSVSVCVLRAPSSSSPKIQFFPFSFVFGGACAHSHFRAATAAPLQPTTSFTSPHTHTEHSPKTKIPPKIFQFVSNRWRRGPSCVCKGESTESLLGQKKKTTQFSRWK